MKDRLIVFLDTCHAWSTLNLIQTFEHISGSMFDGNQPWMVSDLFTYYFYFCILYHNANLEFFII